MNIGDPIKTTLEEMSKFLNIENLIGNPIETEEILMFPITKMGMGFGTGVGEGIEPENSGSGAGAGGAAGVEPMVIVVVFKGVRGPDGVKVISLKEPDAITRAIDGITNAIIKIKEHDKEMIKEMYKKKKSKKK